MAPGPPDLPLAPQGAVELAAPGRRGRTRGSLRRHAPVLVSVLAAATAWSWLLTRPLGPDEGGFLMVARQWAPGTSLYGDYWVDRPPLLIALFGLAGGQVGLRLLGLLAVAVSVLLAARVGHLLAPVADRGERWAAVTAAALLCSPFLGATEVNGELLAVPFVLGAVVAGLEAFGRTGRGDRTDRRRTAGWWFLAGALAATAALVKQNIVDGFVAVAVLAAALALGRAARVRAARDATAYAVAGAAAATGAVLLLAASHGTRLDGLWDALVTFRFDAAEVIGAGSSPYTAGRAAGLVVGATAAGVLTLVVALLTSLAEGLRPSRTGAPAPTPAAPTPAPTPAAAPATGLALALLAWETVGVVAGGSYWRHYLIALVPGLVVAVAGLAGSRSPDTRLRMRGAVAWVLVATTIAVTWSHLGRPHPDHDGTVAAYLRDRARPGDTGVMAFGHPNVLEAAGLASPYEYLWSLPVRVRDPRLTELAAVLSGPDRPTWVVVSGRLLTTWGVDASAGQAVLDRLYRPVAGLDGYTVYLLDSRRA